MAKYFTDFDEQPVGDVTTSGQTAWTPKISNGTSDYRIIDGGDADGKFLRIQAAGTNGSRVLAFNALDGKNDVETLVKFWIFKSGADGSTGRFGASYTRYGGTTEAGTIGYSTNFTPVSSVKSIVLNEDSTGVVQYAAFAWSMSTDYYVRTRVQGNVRSVKIWAASGAEPGSWTFTSTATPPTIASPYSGVGTYQADSYLYVKEFSAATDGDTAPSSKAEYNQYLIDTVNNAVPSSTPLVGWGGGIGSVTGYGRPAGEVLVPSLTNTVLVIADTSHALTSTSPVLTQNHVLVVDNTSHAHAATSPTLTQAHTIAIDSAVHALTSTSPVLAESYILAVSSATHALTSDNIAVVTGFAVIPNSAVHALTSDNITLSQAQTLVIDSAVHAITSTSPTMVEAKTLAVDNAVHALTSDNISMSVTHILAVANALHDHFATSPLLVQAATLVVNNAVHALTSTNIDIIQFTLLNKPDDTVHALTSSLTHLSQEQILDIQNASHRLKSDNILKIINWTDMDVEFGVIYIPSNKTFGEFEEGGTIGEGLYIPTSTQFKEYSSTDVDEEGIYR